METPDLVDDVLPRSGPPLPTSLDEIDSEIARVTAEIARIHSQADYPMTTESSRRIYHSLPDIQNVHIPSGYERAPVTCPYDPSKSKRIDALEMELREILEAKKADDLAVLIQQVHRHQSQFPIKFVPRGVASNQQQPPFNKQLRRNHHVESLEKSALKFLLGDVD